MDPIDRLSVLLIGLFNIALAPQRKKMSAAKSRNGLIGLLVHHTQARVQDIEDRSLSLAMVEPNATALYDYEIHQVFD